MDTTKNMPDDKKPEGSESPQPEVLQTQDQAAATAADAATTDVAGATPTTSLLKKTAGTRRASYRPSSRATFIGIAVVGAIVAVNIGIILFVMQGQSSEEQNVNRETVTISTETLSELGVNRTAVDNVGTELVVGPNAKFNGTLTASSDVSIAGQLRLNNKLTAENASLSNLQAGSVTMNQINASGDATASNLNARRDLTVAGVTRLQGAVNISQLLTVNNNVNITGSLAVGGTLSVRNFQASSLTSDTTLTIGGHIITRGNAPSVSVGGAAGSSGTASISGNDASGTVAVGVGVGGGSGMLASISFRNDYASVPHVVVTPIGRAANIYVSRTANGFSINVSGSLSPGGYAFDYIVMQ